MFMVFMGNILSYGTEKVNSFKILRGEKFGQLVFQLADCPAMSFALV